MPHALFRFPRALYQELRQLASDHGYAAGPEAVIEQTSLTPFLSRLVRAGGRWRPLAPQLEWFAEATLFVPTTYAELERVAADLTVGPGRERSALLHASGVFLLELDEHRVVVAATRPPTFDVRTRIDYLIFLGPSRAAIQAFRATLAARTPSPRLQFWGSRLGGADPEPVPADEVVLPEPFKADLLAWLDRFWQLQEEARALGLPLRRGLLLVGPPGTGKTQLVRHLLTRYPDAPAHLFLPARQTHQEDPFGALLGALQQASSASLVVLEDIDQITASGTVTREFLLNCLDGLVDLPNPVLWVATSNDPTQLDRAILDRPGRFGRIVTFPAPDAESRRQLLARFSRLPVEPDVLEALARAAEGLTGAYLREACTAATLRTIETGEAYATALRDELTRMRRQRTEVSQLARSLTAVQPAGFGIAP